MSKIRWERRNTFTLAPRKTGPCILTEKYNSKIFFCVALFNFATT
jgi:hypothetical protein